MPDHSTNPIPLRCRRNHRQRMKHSCPLPVACARCQAPGRIVWGNIHRVDAVRVECPCRETKLFYGPEAEAQAVRKWNRINKAPAE
ncbi:MAG: hypothetical protein RDU24_08925 [Humidesulfovibrio sp.]|uniref:hypothetical protein n=1 Tax=Humidesulfovibrio sp. TaxID=2910988 RepID=UPI0027F7CD43|nr:hypothetical protein [Humidesulfovibrio sp.]MDQ7835491.1 hypothetical protein [Humidesulfovibrio sp.]